MVMIAIWQMGAAGQAEADMNLRIATGLYLGFWTAIVAGVIYVLTSIGYSFLLAWTLAFLLFVFINGVLAHTFRARQLRREGKAPPPFLVYLFFPKGVQAKIAVPRVVRIILGIVVLLGGVCFLLAGVLLLDHLDSSQALGLHGAIVLLLVLVILGVMSVYIGFRLFVIKNNEGIFKRRQAESSLRDSST